MSSGRSRITSKADGGARIATRRGASESLEPYSSHFSARLSPSSVRVGFEALGGLNSNWTATAKSWALHLSTKAISTTRRNTFRVVTTSLQSRSGIAESDYFAARTA